MKEKFNLQQYGIETETIYRNSSVPVLYELGLRLEKGTAISDVGALMTYSGEKTGRSPKDKRIVRHPDSENNIDWGDINIGLDEHTFMVNHERALDYLNTREHLFVVDAYAGWIQNTASKQESFVLGPTMHYLCRTCSLCLPKRN